MATARTRGEATFASQLASASLYKRNQGRVVRQVTAAALAVIVLLGCWTMSNTILSEYGRSIRVGIPTALGAIGLWVVYRFVNYPRFADFLISVEAEMDKVSWADRTYLVRATGVVLATMVVLGGYLWLCDMFWLWFFNLIHFLDLESMRPE
ncbi:preprotein translocase subunit SecE [Maioricimonas rarisocia]|uniref:Preprotein translocase subunit SecE n=1 Tax=Maioricimonas rarisocia TaxID=2528026 RepID=A0A517ZBL6_9PLAN|nr:preprotein translocase subunit SecE [Maioricimonas rarisocia]QDU39829.1 preprotein translocase subunit SecE [Maioricimonas rarisocia]